MRFPVVFQTGSTLNTCPPVDKVAGFPPYDFYKCQRQEQEIHCHHQPYKEEVFVNVDGPEERRAKLEAKNHHQTDEHGVDSSESHADVMVPSEKLPFHPDKGFRDRMLDEFTMTVKEHLQR